MWTKPAFYCCGVLFLLASNTAIAQSCEFGAIHLQPLSGQSGYDVLADGNYALTMSYTLGVQISGEDCQTAIRLRLKDGGQALQGQGSGVLEFDWHGSSGYAQTDSWIATLSTQQPMTTIALRFRTKQWLSAGPYAGQLEATMDDDALVYNAAALPETRDIQVNVLPIAQIQFYGMTQQHYDFDMGVLTSNKQISGAPRLWVQSNTGYTIRVASGHHGRLRHQSMNEKWDISYQMLLDNNFLDITNPVAEVAYDSLSTGHIIPIGFVIGDTAHKPGGIYSDSLQISVEPDLAIKP